jgi:hypothetical protein
MRVTGVNMTAWEGLVLKDENSTVLHTPHFMRIIERVYKCEAMPQIVNTEGGLCGIPAFRVQSLLYGQKLTSMPLFFYPSLLGTSDDSRAFAHLVDLAEKLGRNVYVEYKTFAELQIESLHNKPIVKRPATIVSVLSLKEDYDRQQAGFSKSRRKELRRRQRRAKERGIQLTTARDIVEVQGFYNVLSRLYRDKHHSIPQPRMIYEQIFRLLVPLGLADFYLALKDGKVLAGNVVLKGKRHWHACGAASSKRCRELGLNGLLSALAIRDAIAAGAKTFDWGASGPHHQGLLDYKSSWGCEHRPFYYYYWNYEPNPSVLGAVHRLVSNFLPYVPLWPIRFVAPYLVPQLA